LGGLTSSVFAAAAILKIGENKKKYIAYKSTGKGENLTFYF
jgi:hypothetical protein